MIVYAVTPVIAAALRTEIVAEVAGLVCVICANGDTFEHFECLGYANAARHGARGAA